MSSKQQGEAEGTAGNGADAGSAEQGQGADAAPEASEQAVEESLASELERARGEAAGHYDRLLRAQAELQNVIKRHDKERSERARYAVEPLARDLLSVVDDLERALQHAGEESRGLATGVELVHRSLLAMLAKHGVERIEAKGKPFDPSEHEAVAMVETAANAENTVVEEHRAGYRLYDRLLRPAMVAVARAPQADGDGAEPA
jgi:molecular chaperone GrpE